VSIKRGQVATERIKAGSAETQCTFEAASILRCNDKDLFYRERQASRRLATNLKSINAISRRRSSVRPQHRRGPLLFVAS